MKKIYSLMLCAMMALSCQTVSAQKGEKAVGLNFSYGSKFEQMGVGIKGQYHFTNHFRGEASFDSFFKKDGVSMWDINFNFHYVIPIAQGLKVYPLVGLTYTHWSSDLDVEVDSDGWGFDISIDGGTSKDEVGANIGGGFQIDFSPNFSFNFEAKYQLISDFDQAVISLGIAYRF